MNDRKQHVISTAHHLFIENGFQATSIQEILDHSNISKGTFYNYFSSKNELLMAIFQYLNQRLNEERDQLLVGQDPTDLSIFVQQIELEFEYNGKNKLFNLLEEAFFSNDPTLKQFLKDSQMHQFHWIYNRFLDLFGEGKQPYLLDCAIMFSGMLHQAIHFNYFSKGKTSNLEPLIRYTVKRLEKMVSEVEKSGDQLFKPDMLKELLPNQTSFKDSFKQKLSTQIHALKDTMNGDRADCKNGELLRFIQEELTQSSSPRQYLVQSALDSLKAREAGAVRSEWESNLGKLERLVADYLEEKALVER